MRLSADDGGRIQLETARLILRPWEAEDWREFRHIAGDPEVMRYIGEGRPWPEERARDFVERQRRLFAERGFCLWKLLAKDSNEMIGFCGIQPLPETVEIEIGWWLARVRWGQGLATEAAREAMRDGFERAGLRRLVAIAQPANKASVHIMEKLGMRLDGLALHRGIEVVRYALNLEEIPTAGAPDHL